MKRLSPLRVALITIFVTVIGCVCIVSIFWPSATTIGDTVTEKVSSAIMADGDDGSSTYGTTTSTATFVYLGACSKLYTTEDAVSPVGIFLDTFEKDKLAEWIDSAGFPYKQQYFATTSSSEPMRYLIRTASGSTFWVEP